MCQSVPILLGLRRSRYVCLLILLSSLILRISVSAPVKQNEQAMSYRIGETLPYDLCFFSFFIMRFAYWRTESVCIIRRCAANRKKNLRNIIWKLQTLQIWTPLPIGAACIVASVPRRYALFFHRLSILERATDHGCIIIAITQKRCGQDSSATAL